MSFWRESAEVIQPVVPHYMAPCWFTLDPASLLVTSHFNEYMPVLPPESLAHEYYDDDVHKLADVARSASGVSTLHEATGGDPRRARAGRPTWSWAETRSCSSPCARARGEAWGVLGLYREPGRPDVRAATRSTSCARSPPLLAEGARRGAAAGRGGRPGGAGGARAARPLAPTGSVESATPGVERWLSDLPERRLGGRRGCPPRCWPSPARALRSAGGPRRAGRGRAGARAHPRRAAGWCCTARRW